MNVGDGPVMGAGGGRVECDPGPRRGSRPGADLTRAGNGHLRNARPIHGDRSSYTKAPSPTPLGERLGAFTCYERSPSIAPRFRRCPFPALQRPDATNPPAESDNGSNKSDSLVRSTSLT